MLFCLEINFGASILCFWYDFVLPSGVLVSAERADLFRDGVLHPILDKTQSPGKRVSIGGYLSIRFDHSMEYWVRPFLSLGSSCHWQGFQGTYLGGRVWISSFVRIYCYNLKLHNLCIHVTYPTPRELWEEL